MPKPDPVADINAAFPAGEWTLDQVRDAQRIIAVGAAADWAEQVWLLMVMARDVAPEDERKEWVTQAFTSYAEGLDRTVNRIADDLGMDLVARHAMANDMSAVFNARLGEVIAASTATGGRA